MLEAQTGHDLMVTNEIGNVVLGVEDIVVDGIVPSEQFVAEGHIVGRVVGTVKDIDEWELA